MKKQEVMSAVEALLAKHKVDKSSELSKDLLELFATKRSISEDFPPHTDADGNVTEVYCSWFKEYRPVTEFTLSSKTKYGYFNKCNDGKKEWRKYDKAIKDLKVKQEEVTNDILDGKLTVEAGKKKRAAILKDIATLEHNRHEKINFNEKTAGL